MSKENNPQRTTAPLSKRIIFLVLPVISFLFISYVFAQENNISEEIIQYLRANKEIANKDTLQTTEYSTKSSELMNKLNKKEINMEDYQKISSEQAKARVEQLSNLKSEVQSLNPPPKLITHHELLLKFYEEAIKSAESETNNDYEAALQHNLKANDYQRQGEAELKKYGISGIINDVLTQ